MKVVPIIGGDGVLPTMYYKSMRIVSLEPYITDLIISLGLTESLVGVSFRCNELPNLPKATTGKASLSEEFCSEDLEIATIKTLSPDIIIGSISPDEDGKVLKGAQASAARLFGDDVHFQTYSPCSLESVYEGIDDLAKVLGVAAKGRELSSRMKAQFMDWCDNFYDRMKNKKVTIVSSLEPFSLAGRWIPDMVSLASAHSQSVSGNIKQRKITWDDVVAFKPDVLVFAPEGRTLQESVQSFPEFAKLPHFEDIPAVKRGEVFFTDGELHFYRPSLKLIESMAILLSTIGGFESGYITPRDSFYRLRWLELHRHKFIPTKKK